MKPYLQLTQLIKSFGKDLPVVHIDSLGIAKGNIVAIVGESGSGKTTLMRLIAGLELPSSGKIVLHDKIVNDASTFIVPKNRKVGLVFQDYALFPHLTVKENIVYGVLEKKYAASRMHEMLALVALTGYEKRYPHQLSGGQQQRVAIARALASHPELLILDEPFSNLDTSLKLQLRNDVFAILKNAGVTALFVTHDVEDAIAIADEIVVLKAGHVAQKGTAKEIYEKPLSIYVASLFGAVMQLSETSLIHFGFSPQKNHSYALRHFDFLVDKTCTFSTQATVIKSAFKEGYYINTVKIANNVLLNCTSKKELTGLIKIGFEQESLLIFEA
jgi:iron(III) transport system ATP-binding protein